MLHDGRVLLAGGWRAETRQDVATVDLYDPSTQTWAAGPPLLDPRRDASAVTLRDGRVLVLGGEDPGDQRRAEIFDPATGTWTRAASSIAGRAGTTSFLLDDGRVLFLGGGDYSSETPGGEIYDPARDSWSLTAAPHAVGGAGRPVVRLRDGRFLVVGTTTVFAAPPTYDTPAAEIYDAERDTWTEVAPPQYVGEGSGAALLADGRVLVAGGRPGGGPEHPLDATAHRHSEIFDPATGSWSPTGELNEPRAGATTFVPLSDGRVAAIGGSWATIVGPLGQRSFGQISYPAPAEVYDPAGGSWQPMPPMSLARAGHVTGPRRLRPTRAGVLVVKLRCSSGGAACADRLLLRGRGRTLAQRTVSVRAGAAVGVRVTLSATARRRGGRCVTGRRG